MSSQKQNVLIIGGGNAGAQVAARLSDSLDPSRFTLQLVTDRTFHIWYPGLIRAVVTAEGNWEDVVLNSYDKLFKHGKAGELVVGVVDRLDDDRAYLTDGGSLSYDWLVLATGNTWDGPLKLPVDRENTRVWLEGWHEKFANARNVVIIGAGSAGIEYAGEIRHFHPDKKVTLIHGQSQILNSAYTDKYRNATARALKVRGIYTVLGDRATVPEGQFTSIKTEKGVEIPADLVIPVRGGKLNTGFLSSYDSSILTPKGHVKVLPTLQVPLVSGKRNVFAIGDIIDWPEEKTFAKIDPQAAVLVPNILSSVKGQPMKKKYGGDTEIIVVTLGPAGGSGYIPIPIVGGGIIVGDFLSSFIKSRHLFVNMPLEFLRLIPRIPLPIVLVFKLLLHWWACFLLWFAM